ncbi:uncharacterized protein LOC106882731 [Octopus bimaculoides]|uniref:Uncharacterized protein n=1 Tax=Octopus bimaculoides TaxID=37653 RepID=A0A0L8FKT0_OCTBM|nr:uncharacterized protein LOC106882731 [Octopus bimaculoides]|eukprot:XP_014788986.1 PREDICTED: uncharacterized protein LOC106882731 [Octopus bimaculoides]
MDYCLKLFVYSTLLLKPAFSQAFSLNNFHSLTERLWLYNNEIACPTNTTTNNFLVAHPDYLKSTEPHLNDSITVATIWVRLPQGDVLFRDNIPSSFQLNFLCNPSVKSPFDKCAVGNCFVLSTTDKQLEGDDSIAYNSRADVLEVENVINVTSSDACSGSKQLILGIIPQQCLTLPPHESTTPSSGSLVVFIMTVLLTIVILYFVCGTCCNYISGLRGSDSIPHINCLTQVGNCFQDIWYRIKCCDRYRGPYQEI